MKLRSGFAIAALGVVISLAASADYPAHRDSPLDSPVRFDGKPITLKRFAAVLTESGLTIKYPDHLANRKICVAAKSHPVRVVLDALTDLEGWTWRATDEQSVSIEELPAVVRPQETLYAAIRRIMPPDFVTFLKMAPLDKFTVGASGGAALSNRAASVTQQLQVAMLGRTEELEKAPVLLSKLSSEQKELVSLAILLSPAFQRASDELLSNSTWQFARPEATRLSLQQGTILMLECDLGPGRQSGAFGANLAADEQ